MVSLKDGSDCNANIIYVSFDYREIPLLCPNALYQLARPYMWREVGKIKTAFSLLFDKLSGTSYESTGKSLLLLWTTVVKNKPSSI